MNNDKVGRRGFLHAAAGTAAFTILKPQLVRGMQANSAVRVGLLGCGHRGTAHTETILKNTDARVVALADLFQEQIDIAKKHVDELSQGKGHAGVAQTFVGAQAYEQILGSKEV